MGGIETVNSREEELVLDVIRKKRIFRYGFSDKEVSQSYVLRFEEVFKNYLSAGYALAVSSGTAALRTALAALEVKPGAEIIVPAYTFIATLEAVIESGAKPVLAEIDSSLNIDPTDLEKRITARTQGIMPVHMMGASADMDAILGIARKHKLFVLEDACQAIGARYKGKFVGILGDVSAFSFDSVKLLTCGEGGMVVTSNGEFYRRADRFHDHGHIHNLALPRGKEPKEGTGFNFRLSEILAAFGLAQLEKLPEMLVSLRANRTRMMEGINLPAGFSWRSLPADAEDSATFVTFLAPTPDKAEKVKERLQKSGITPATLNYWHYQVNRELAGTGAYPRTEEYLGRAVALEVKVRMEVSQITRINEVLKDALSPFLPSVS